MDCCVSANPFSLFLHEPGTRGAPGSLSPGGQAARDSRIHCQRGASVKGLRNPSRKARLSLSGNPLFRPAVEQLEDRTLLSAATMNVASLIAQSAESYAHYVNQDYMTLLQRPADPAGLDV